MSVYSDVRAGVREVALTALITEFPTVSVIFSNLNGTEPAESYVVVNILFIDQIGQQRVSTLLDLNEKLSVSAFYEVQVQFSFCGSLSGDMSHTFNYKIGNDPWVKEELLRNNLGYMNKTQVRRNPQKRDTQWVEYHSMDVTFNFTHNVQQTVDVIEHVALEDNLTGTQYIIPPYTP